MTDTAELAYDARGDPDAAPLYLLHGYPFSRAVWNPVTARLSDAARVVAPDLRGFGASPLPAGGYAIDDVARDVLALADKLGHGRIDVAGHSMGGYVALALARLAPDRLRKLVLVTTRASADSEAAKAGRRKQSDMVQMDGTRALADLLVPKLTAPSTPGVVRDEARVLVESSRVSGIVDALGAMRERPDATASLPSIRAPTLVIAGGEDSLMPRAEQSALVDRIPGARLVVLERSGHLPMMEEPEAFARVVVEFLKE